MADFSKRFVSLVLFFILFSSQQVLSKDSAGADGIPYEQCDWKNKEYTENTVKTAMSSISSLDTEAASICVECLSESAAPILRNLLQGLVEHDSTIPDACFYASMLKAQKPGFQNYYYCPGGKLSSTMAYHSCDVKGGNCKLGRRGPGRKRNLYRRRFCLSEDYVQMTAKSFHQVANCFGISNREKRELFSLFNHESSFMLNSKSSGGARCYGQLTSDVYHTVNRYVFYRDVVDEWNTETNIYKKAFNNCPFLQNKVIKQSFENREPKKLKVDDYDKKFKASSSVFTCSVSHDPYTCFFYSIYNYKINKSYFYEKYNAIPRSSEFEEGAYDLFLLPIKLNEMITVKGKVKGKDGQDMEVNWAIADEGELQAILSRINSYNTEDLQVKKVNVFSKEYLMKDVVQRSYNGGISIIDSHFPIFIKGLKRKLSSKSCVKDNLCRRYRDLIQNGRSLSPSDLNKRFSQYLSKTKGIVGEPDTFVGSIQRDLCYLQNSENDMKNDIKQISHGFSDEEVGTFVKQVGNMCPQNIPPVKCE